MKSQRGMSLIEVVVSLFILGVLIVLYATSLNVMARTRQLKLESIAYHIASRKIEELRALPYASLPGSGPVTDPQISDLPAGSAAFTVEDYPPYDGMKELTVTVSWDDGIARNVVIKTLAGTGGINPF